MDDGGYIKLWRKFIDWEWYDDNNCKVVFLHLLLKSNYKQKRWRGKIIERGQFFTSTENLSNEVHLSPMQLRIVLSKLEKTGEIIRQGTSEGTYITVCKYDSYQTVPPAEQQADNKPVTSEQQASNKRVTTTNKEKNIEEGEEVITGTPVDVPKIPIQDLPDWIISEWAKGYEKSFGMKYSIASLGKERAAAAVLIKHYKQQFPDGKTEDAKERFSNWFPLVIYIDDAFIQDNLTLSMVASKFNEINKILRNGKYKVLNKNGNRPATREDLTRVIDKYFPLNQGSVQ
jgi:hypothetical protein